MRRGKGGLRRRRCGARLPRPSAPRSAKMFLFLNCGGPLANRCAGKRQVYEDKSPSTVRAEQLAEKDERGKLAELSSPTDGVLTCEADSASAHTIGQPSRGRFHGQSGHGSPASFNKSPSP
eukprot:scaffold3815_cov251-Pinguiococcus_pyrenoidosus.AAC.8